MWLWSSLSVWIASAVVLGDKPFSLRPFVELYTPLATNNSECSAELLYFQDAARNLTPWALEMLDASSKTPSSLLVGNIVDLGDFHECLAVRSDAQPGVEASISVIGKYCSVKATFNRTTEEITLGDLVEEWRWSVCMPASCTSDDLTTQLEYFLTKNSSTASKIQTIFCKSSLDYTRLSLGSWIFIVCTLSWLVLVFLATWIEKRSIKIPQQVQSVVLPFSLVTNGKMLLDKVPPGHVNCMCGIKVLAAFKIVLVHRYLSAAKETLTNLHLAQDMFSSTLTGVISQTSEVDLFFMFSGILQARGFMTERKSETPFSYAKYILHRYLRLTPVYFFILLIYMTVLYDLGSGPVWEDIVGVFNKNCIKNWWLNMLYVNNYVENQKSVTCISESWYLAADLQLYIVAPLFLFVLYKKNTLGIILMIITILVCCLYTFYSWLILYQKGSISDAETQDKLSRDFHTQTQYRMSPYLIGLLLGFFLERFKKEKIVMSKPTQILGWTSSAVISITYIYLPLMRYLAWVNSATIFVELPYGAFFAAAFGWIVFACDQGYGGLLNTFLSHHFFQILSRLTYAVYLTHKMFIYYDVGITQTAGFFSQYSNFQKSLADFISANLFSIFLVLAVEYPCMNLVNLLFKKNK